MVPSPISCFVFIFLFLVLIFVFFLFLVFVFLFLILFIPFALEVCFKCAGFASACPDGTLRLYRLIRRSLELKGESEPS